MTISALNLNLANSESPRVVTPD